MSWAYDSVALPSAGNAGSAAAAYAAAGGLSCVVAMPRDVPYANQVETRLFGAEVILVDGLIGDAGRLIREQASDRGWFDLSTLREPYRQEGKKTMGIELAEQGGWGEQCLPDVIVYPTGGGTGIVGMWKAFEELEELGWIGARRPRMVVVQAEGCAPIVQAFARGERYAEPWPNAQTAAAGLRVPSAIGDYLILDAVRASSGTALAVSEAAIADAQVEMGRLTGMYAAPEAAATWAAVRDLRRTVFSRGRNESFCSVPAPGSSTTRRRWLRNEPVLHGPDADLCARPQAELAAHVRDDTTHHE